jgi:hypothetical protein
MNEEALRALIRDTVARHLGALAAGAAAQPMAPTGVIHPSHARFRLLSGGDLDGPCLIEPSVSCNHCGYCQSHGH